MNVHVVRPLVLAVASLASLPVVGRAQPLPAFPERVPLELTSPAFSDRQVAERLALLDRLVATPTPPGAASAFSDLARSLQDGRLTRAQESRVVRHLNDVARARPELGESRDAAVRTITAFTPGKGAPDIVGPDLAGVPLRLSDYRGKVVVLLFGADWCGICRTQQPYERLMLELYRNWPFALLSIETGSSAEGTLRAKAEAGLTFRSWWDEPTTAGPGPIASAWNVNGFPAVYVLDANGIIRFVGLRDEDLLKGVRQLLDETIAQRPLGAPALARRN